MSPKVVRYCAVLLIVSIPILQASYHGSHPKCTKIPASDVYHGTCYFQHVVGKGYVRKTCPSGTRYRHQACGCVGASDANRDGGSNTYANGGTSMDNDDDDVEESDFVDDVKSSFVRSLVDSSPLSVLRFLFGEKEDNERDDDVRNADNEREEHDADDAEKNHDRNNNFDGYKSYGDDLDRDDMGGFDGFGSREAGSRGHEVDDSHYAKMHGETEVRGDGDDEGDDDGFSQIRNSRYFDKLSVGGRSKNEDENDDADVDNDDGRDDASKEMNENEVESPHRHYRHGYGSIYSVKGMLSREKQYRYEDLFTNLFDGDDDDDDKEHDDDDDDDDLGGVGGGGVGGGGGGDDLFENYGEIYDDKLDGVLEYVDDILDDLFDDDFDDFYEDIFDDDGYDDCFVKKYDHYFDDDFQDEIDEKYDDFDDFFKNYDRIKSLTSSLENRDDDDDNDDDDDVNDDDRNNNVSEDKDTYYESEASRYLFGRHGKENNGLATDNIGDDKNDDRDDDGRSGKGNFDIFQNVPVNTKSSPPRDSRLFDFTKMLKQSGDEEQSQNVFDVFSRDLTKH